jgi:photosystem II stability/assembly factor-like uncharacterized protein
MKTKIGFVAFLVFIQALAFSQGWSRLNPGITNNLYYIDFLNENTGYVGAPLIRTTNGGANWTLVPGGSNFHSVCFLDTNTGYATDGSSTGPGGMYKTTNGGINWTLQPTAEYVCQLDFVNVNTGYFVNNFDWNVADFLGTTNGGLTWNVLSVWLLNGPNVDGISWRKLKFLNANEGYLIGENYVNSVFSTSYVLKTINGGLNWEYAFTSTNCVLNDCSYTSLNNGYVTGAKAFSIDTGKVFNQSGNILYKNFHILNGISSPVPSTAYAVGAAGTLVKTTNFGSTWNLQNPNVSVKLSAVKFVNEYVGYIVGDSGTILKTVTAGETPLSISGTIRYQDNNQPVNSGFVRALKYDSVSKQILIIDSASIQPTGAYTLSHIPPGISLDIMAFENDENQLNFVPTYYPSTTSWQNATTLTVSSNLTGIDVLVYRINNTGGPYHIAGSINGIFQTMINLNGAIVYAKLGTNYQAYSLTDNSGHYCIDSLNPGTYTLIVDRMGFFAQTRQVVITNFNKDTIDFTMGNGTLLGTSQEGNVIPDDYSLGVNYPNPFNPSTKISFSIPKESKIGITIYDILGKEIAVLVNAELKAGNYSVAWNASEFASGVYFCRMEAEGFVRTQKIVLLK